MRTRKIPGRCYYCGRQPAKVSTVYQPTDHNTYIISRHILCEGCASEYAHAPWGFAVEDAEVDA